MKPLRLTAREAILEAAALVFSENPGAPLSEVAVRAGVGRATLHRQFGGRNELMEALSMEALDQTDAATADMYDAPTARIALRRMFESVIPLGTRYGFLRHERDSQNPELKRRYKRQLDGVVELVGVLKLEGDIAEDVPTAWVAEMIDSLIWVGWSVMDRGELSQEEAADLASRTLLEGLGRKAPLAAE